MVSSECLDKFLQENTFHAVEHNITTPSFPDWKASTLSRSPFPLVKPHLYTLNEPLVVIKCWHIIIINGRLKVACYVYKRTRIETVSTLFLEIELDQVSWAWLQNKH